MEENIMQDEVYGRRAINRQFKGSKCERKAGGQTHFDDVVGKLGNRGGKEDR